ncbi:hypothetical protein LWI28_008195 [Acer negundo]|uniref:Uncharacterized protein n=1 Tax=Acer negundo TaxID=4023 RepID=A0AAD5IZW3_ACENE|nr:hypothetical protein LWI28_008195 [Acer negundo]
MGRKEEEINPHIPKYMSNVLWYINSEKSNGHGNQEPSDGPRNILPRMKKSRPSSSITMKPREITGTATIYHTSDYNYSLLVERYEARVEARRNYLEKKQLLVEKSDEAKVDDDYEFVQRVLQNVCVQVVVLVVSREA